MSYRVLLYFLCLPSLAEAGTWKESFKFHLDSSPFERNSLHLGFSKETQDEAEKFPDVVYVASERGDVQVDHDNVGNLFFTDRRIHGRVPIPTNKENIALASLEVIFKDGAGAFSFAKYDLEDEIGGRVRKSTKFFSSKQSHLSGPAYDLLEQKMRFGMASKPSSFGTDDFQIYHKSAHSEDKIFYLLGRNYRDIIQKIWKARGNSERKIRAVILHVHSRFDMCGSCAYSLDWELKEGFGKNILDFCGTLNGNYLLPIDVSAFVSSRQEYLVWGPSRRTLPVPPLPRDPSLSHAQLRDEYKRVIDFSRDLSAPKTFTQSVVPPFI
jgi:hypothetical protein